MICVPVIGPSQTEALRQIKAAQTKGADMVELRLDLIHKPNVEALIQCARVPIIATCRPKRFKGGFKGPEKARFAILDHAARSGAAYVDVEHDCAGKFSPAGQAKLILSYHNFSHTPRDLKEKFRTLASHKPVIVKLATWAGHVMDNFRMFRLLDAVSKKQKTVGLCMGPKGMVSRLANRRYGSFFTFASLGAGTESAPGQISLDAMKDVYQDIQLNRRTPLYAVIGNPVGHSMSPYLHNRLFAKYNMNRFYVPLEIEGNPVPVIQEAVSLGFRGFSITIPHKKTVMRAADWLEPLGKDIGAINTLAYRAGKIRAYNTDCRAALAAILKRTSLKDKTAAVIGAGGVGTALAFGLASEGASVHVTDFYPAKAKALARDIKGKVFKLADIPALKPDVLLNASPIGMKPKVNATPIPGKYIQKGMVVLDAVYNPIETRFLKEAKKRACRTIDGLEMFVAQAAGQFRIWTGIDPDVRWMRKHVIKAMSASR